MKLENFEQKEIKKYNEKNISNIKLLEIFVTIHNENFENKVEDKYFLEITENNQYSLYYLEKLGDILGYIVFYDSFDNFDLFEIAIKKGEHKKGLGNFLLKNVINEIFFFNNEKNSILLEVNENNNNAIKLYEKNGFKKIFIRKNYYGNGKNAIIMQKDICEKKL